MEIIFYITLFLIGILFGSFYTLAVYRIPKRQDIVHTHSYCPKCNHKLRFLDLIPVFSYLFLGAKCHYCKEKIRPRYFIIEIISGFVFLVLALLMNLSLETLNVIKIMEYIFFVFYFTFLVLMAGIDREQKRIEKPVLMYGIFLSILYIIYLYIIEKASIYRYGIYLLCFVILLMLDTLFLKKKAKESYPLHIFIILMIMAIFTGEYVTIHTAILGLIAVALSLKSHKKKNDTEEEIASLRNVGFYLAISNIVYYLFVLCLCQFL